MTAMIALLLWENVIPGMSTPLLGTFALWVAAILTLWSMFHYLRMPRRISAVRAPSARSGDADAQGETDASMPRRRRRSRAEASSSRQARGRPSHAAADGVRVAPC